ncbi:MAG: T9SS type A sorting domain-containing protein [Bacteroidota bacterium]
MSGKIIFEGNNVEQKDFSSLSNGMYFLKISGHSPKTIQLIKKSN